ncbi:D-2-hydroxyacid dehydrogenase [Motiliproteus coralliicola]|uniref:D-2-hydroxyacid dehydrogenase n=1 Tax=Motiliproteus coralliicola TaxID=2283196 RepID=A0A369WST4_9GAMM|nr:D-2-hydroxyacid dehydrogenase [Motiliproteus coralliicola]RDE22545.1 D-2-hydroxyacid dehydrogenase [Motiliproteus coralliicola]
MNHRQQTDPLRVLVVSEELSSYQQLLQQPEASLTRVEYGFAEDIEAAREAAAQAQVLFGDPDLLLDLLDSCGPQLRWIQSSWAGVAPLIARLKGREAAPQLTNIRGIFGPLMTEYVFAYLLAHERRLLERWQSQQQRRWDARPGAGLQGKTLGLLGLGSIGSHVAGVARAFGMRVLGCSRTPPKAGTVDKHFLSAELGQMLTEIDYLVCTLPSTPETRNLLDAAMLARMRAGAVLINAGRGDLIDDQALIEALQQQRLAAAVLDVFRQEPLPPEHSFWDQPNLLISSHTAAPSYPSQVVPIFLDNLQRFQRGQPLQFRVDLERGY